EVTSPRDVPTRVEVITRRDAYDRDHDTFMAHWRAKDTRLRNAILKARLTLPTLTTPAAVLHDCAALCIAIGSDGLRGELTLLKAARAQAAFEKSAAVTRAHLRSVAGMALSHRMRRDPLDDAGSTARVLRAVAEILP
ncbi:MAG: magnesium chelatase ATPase subunit I, partial [Paracoccaceae bacterium]